MENYVKARVKLTNTQLNRLKSAAKNKTGTGFTRFTEHQPTKQQNTYYLLTNPPTYRLLTNRPANPITIFKTRANRKTSILQNIKWCYRTVSFTAIYSKGLKIYWKQIPSQSEIKNNLWHRICHTTLHCYF